MCLLMYVFISLHVLKEACYQNAALMSTTDHVAVHGGVDSRCSALIPEAVPCSVLRNMQVVNPVSSGMSAKSFVLSHRPTYLRKLPPDVDEYHGG